MKSVTVPLVVRPVMFANTIVMTASLLMNSSSARGQTTPYYPPGTSTTFSSLEAVNSDGSSSYAFPSNGSPITVVGVVLNNPSTMLDSTPNYNTTPWNLGGQWQIFIQAYSDSTVGGTQDDFGGAEVWMGQCYGNLGFINEPGTSLTSPPGDSYSNSQWSSIVSNLNNPSLITGGTVALQAGDVVAVTSLGLEYEGMVNLNQQHMINNPMSITVLETGAALPSPTVTTLRQLQSANGTFYFDPTRQTGAESLQGTQVQLDGLRLLSGTWAPNSQVVVTDGSLRQMILNLGNNPNLTTAPTALFNVIGIEDQESTDGTNQDGYTLWVTGSASVTAVPKSGGTFNWSGTNGSWNSMSNWTPSSKPQSASDVAIFGGSLAQAQTVTLDGPQKAGTLIFANTNPLTTGYAVTSGTGGTLTLDNSGATALVTVMSGTHSISAPLALSDNLNVSVASSSAITLAGNIQENSTGMSLTLDGNGQLVLSGSNNYSGGTNVDSGVLVLDGFASLPVGGSLTIGALSSSTFSAIPTSVSPSVPSQLSPAPEPSTLALAVVALSCLLLKFRSRLKIVR